jgi:hypothetical protein
MKRAIPIAVWLVRQPRSLESQQDIAYQDLCIQCMVVVKKFLRISRASTRSLA